MNILTNITNDNINILSNIQLNENSIKIKDPMSLSNLKECISFYCLTIKFEEYMNCKFGKKLIRVSNFPSHISENIVKFVFAKKYNFMPTWDTNSGDLMCHNKKIQVKGSINLSNGPSSFGPSENWVYIYFVDAKDICKSQFKVWEIKLSNTSEIWKNIKVNKSDTFYTQCQQGRRPRINFFKIKSQIPSKYCELIFDGSIDELQMKNERIKYHSIVNQNL